LDLDTKKGYDSEREVAVFKRTADEHGTPFVEVDREVRLYIETCGDKCVLEMFMRMVKTDGDGVALFPFKRLSHPIIIGGSSQKFDSTKELEANDVLRKILVSLREKVLS
jgi:hypothetical protein